MRQEEIEVKISTTKKFNFSLNDKKFKTKEI